jgi:hypothetical protein
MCDYGEKLYLSTLEIEILKTYFIRTKIRKYISTYAKGKR